MGIAASAPSVSQGWASEKPPWIASMTSDSRYNAAKAIADSPTSVAVGMLRTWVWQRAYGPYVHHPSGSLTAAATSFLLARWAPWWAPW